MTPRDAESPPVAPTGWQARLYEDLGGDSLYREMTDRVNSIVLLWDTETRIAYINPFGARLFGYEVEELVGRSVLGTIVAEEESAGQDLRELMWQIVADPERYGQNDNENMTKDGRRVWVSWSNQALRNLDGSVRYVLSVGNDISRLRQAQERQRLAQEMVENVNSLVLLWGSDLRIAYINAFGARLFGYEVDELLGQSVLGTLVADAPDVEASLHELMSQMVSGEQFQATALPEPSSFEAFVNMPNRHYGDRSGMSSYVSRDGREIWLSWSNQALRNSDGSFRYLLSVGNDITELKKAQDRIIEQAQQSASLLERHRLSRELHDSVSQALYGIALGARTARELVDRDASRAAQPLDYVMSLAEAGLAEMRALIFELRPDSLEAEGLVVALRKQIAATAARYSISIESDLEEEPDLSLAEKEVCYRVAQEALHNVVKHARASTAAVCLKSAGGHATVEVRDDGVGFDASASFPGHLGLKSMAERAASVGADLRLESKPGAGTTVRLNTAVRNEPK